MLTPAISTVYGLASLLDRRLVTGW